MFSTSESIFTLLAASVQNKSWEHSSGSREEVLARIEEASIWLEGSSLFSLLVSKAPAATASSLRAAKPVTSAAVRERSVVVPEATAMAIVASEEVGRRRRRERRRAEERSRVECIFTAV